MTRSSSTAQQSRLAALWADVRPGTPVHVRRDDGSVTVTQTRSEAWLLPSGTAVIQVVGISGCYALDRVSLAGPAQPVVLAPVPAPAAQSPALPDVDPVSSAGAVMLVAASALTVMVGLKVLLMAVLGGGL